MTENKIGKPHSFDMNLHIAAINQMVCADEVDFALDMIDKVPGFFRDNKPKELVNLKKELLQHTFDHFAYIEAEAPIKKEDLEYTITADQCFPRADLLAAEIKKLNEKEKIPWVFELAPGEGWLPIGLEKFGHQFDYYAKTLNQSMEKHLKESVKNWSERPVKFQHTMFVCYELIEHLRNPDDILHTFIRSGVNFDQIFLSTPKYTYAGGHKEWRGNALGHLRTWTPTEFITWANIKFPDYEFKHYEHETMVLVGNRHG